MNKISTSHTLKIIGMVVIGAVFLIGAGNALDDRIDRLEYINETTHDILVDMRDDLDYIRDRLDRSEHGVQH